ncbi:MAG: VWA domain-containing protein [Planctomycetota bacterium]|nr:VWA domain-containing protein [Planctomycetota bacterium]
MGLVVLAALHGCGTGGSNPTPTPNPTPNTPPSAEQPAPPDALEIVFTYGSEKEDWIKEVTAGFNQAANKTAGGKTIFVKAIPMGSGECIDEILSGRRQVHLTSPASAAFIKLGNAESRTKTGKDLIPSSENLVLSPVVIAMWKPMAEALGWGQKPIGWSEILDLAKNPKGWGAYGHDEWGSFKFGHTHPEFSNSGLISLFAEVYAAAGKTAGLTIEDVAKPETKAYLSGIERSIVHYGSSTGFFGKKLFANGPQYLSAAVLYENMVMEAATPGKWNLPFPVVAIYPKEGTFWSDHPAGIVDREWVTPEHKEAAKAYLKYLLETPQQERALNYGFRPADPAIQLGDRFSAANGVDAKEPKTTLEVPGTDVMAEILKAWHENKKHSNIALVIDTSGSMQEDNKIANARLGAEQFVKILNEQDRFSLMNFNNKAYWALKDVSIKDQRAQAVTRVQGLFPDGGTALFDAIDEAYQHMLAAQGKDRISAIVVLSDGQDTNSRIKLPQLLERIRFDSELRTIRVFTIGYGKGAKGAIADLKAIAEATQAKYYDGAPENIVTVFKDISTFF